MRRYRRSVQMKLQRMSLNDWRRWKRNPQEHGASRNHGGTRCLRTSRPRVVRVGVTSQVSNVPRSRQSSEHITKRCFSCYKGTQNTFRQRFALAMNDSFALISPVLAMTIWHDNILHDALFGVARARMTKCHLEVPLGNSPLHAHLAGSCTDLVGSTELRLVGAPYPKHDRTTHMNDTLANSHLTRQIISRAPEQVLPVRTLWHFCRKVSGSAISSTSKWT